MNRTQFSILSMALAAAAITGRAPSNPGAATAAPPTPPWIGEALPADRLDRMAAHAQLLKELKPSDGMQVQSLIAKSKRWPPGHTVTVAFRGGTTELHRQIAAAARVWPATGNIGLDFGWDPESKTYRTWSVSDTAPAADVRIGFDHAGYWSCVGTDSTVSDCARANESSMNFAGFAAGPPTGWQTIVIHEFGHALSLEHEHQNPSGGCEAAFRWDDDPGYQRTQDADQNFIADPAGRKPGIHTVLGGPPNNWAKEKVDRNLRQLPDSSAYLRSEFDPRSIMRYDFPEWMYKPNTGSACRGFKAEDLSALDRQGIAQAYPRGPSDLQEAGAAQVSALKRLGTIPGLGAETKALYREKVKSVVSSMK